MTERTARQLALIEEVVTVTGRLGIGIWLRGGWAMDFFLGEVTRDHEDIDFFAWAAQATALAAALSRHGYERLPGPDAERQLNVAKQGEEVQFALLAPDSTGGVALNGGPWAGTPYPEAVPHHEPGRIGALECPIVHPRGQIEMKRMMPEWNPRLRRRSKDAADIARLCAALSPPEPSAS